MSLFHVLQHASESDLPEIIRRNLGKAPEGDPPNWNVPTNFHEIDEKTLCQETRLAVYAPQFIEWRQLPIDGKTKPIISIRLFWFHDGTCVGLSLDYWAGKVRWFAGGCQHEFEEKKVGNCLHQRTCKKCNYEEVVDSSD
jgi:hypothetical protein